MDSNAYQLELVRHQDLTPRVRSFECRFVDKDCFEFQPGQFISMEFSLDGVTYLRSYSVASPPRGDDSMEILARYNAGGPGTRYLWGMKPGFRFTANGPFGSFLLRQPELRDSLFVASGTGIAPVRSMLHSILKGQGGLEITLLFGVRDQSDLLYESEFVELARLNPDFSYRVILSRPLNGWSGLEGHVQHHLDDALRSRKAADAYISGSQKMVEQVRRALEERGFDPSAIHYEKGDA